MPCLVVSLPSSGAGDRNERVGNRRPVKVMIISTFSSRLRCGSGVSNRGAPSGCQACRLTTRQCTATRCRHRPPPPAARHDRAPSGPSQAPGGRGLLRREAPSTTRPSWQSAERGRSSNRETGAGERPVRGRGEERQVRLLGRARRRPRRLRRGRRAVEGEHRAQQRRRPRIQQQVRVAPSARECGNSNTTCPRSPSSAPAPQRAQKIAR